MLLAIDIGNTNVTLGLFDGSGWLEQWRLRTVHEKTVDEYWISVRTLLRDRNLLEAVSSVVLSSVVPPLTTTFEQMTERYLQMKPVRVSAETHTGIRVTTDNPAEVGADRIVNAAAVAATHDLPAIVIDMGTATTFDVVLPPAEAGQLPTLAGVVIAPGLRLAADALARRAAQLSRVALEAPPHVLGRNTTHAVQSGLIFGYVSMIEGMVARLSAELEITPTVIGTGGLISLIDPYTDTIHHVEPWLTLIGLRVIADLNRSEAAA